MCQEALIRWGCCGKEWVPESDQNFTRPLLAICDQVPVRPKILEDGRTILRASRCTNLVRGVPAEDWHEVDSPTFPSYSCGDCCWAARPASKFAPRADRDDRCHWRRCLAVDTKQHAELEGLQRIFNRHPRILSDIWPLIDTMSSIKTCFNYMWQCALQSFETPTPWCREVADSQVFDCFRDYCGLLDSFIKWSTFYRRCEEVMSGHESSDTEPEDEGIDAAPETKGMDAAPKDEGIDE